ncbi:MAG: outer membrane lipoprotein-sorting protein [Prolixibacteraceae bacterium]|nr:outer membrane lipoprotein-sorting protein [Prolixibacteraceae bacterium]
MINKILFIGTIMLLLGLGSQAQTAREIISKSNKAIETNAMEMLSTLNIYNPKGDVRVRQIATATKKFGEVSKTIIRFTAPPDVTGTTMLIHDYPNRDDDMWIYLPALRKSRRIVSSEKGNNFMGSEFTNSDMSVPNIDDFDYKLLSKSIIEGKACYTIESVPKNEQIAGNYGTKRKVSYIEKTNFLALKVEHYDLKNQLKREQIIADYRKHDNGKWFAYTMEMKNLQNGRRSVLIVDAFQNSSTMTEEQFSPAMLDR